jgi:2-phospho-L-lactate guanylyltransferase
MTFWAIVPVKPLRRGKSRLSAVLTEDERTQLNRQLLIHTVQVLNQVPGLEDVLVVSRDPQALAVARDHDARTLLEDGSPHLNVALARATVVARTYNARGVLIMPADLPHLNAEDVQTMLTAGDHPPVVVLAPDQRREGTNAMLINPAGLIEYDFGPQSFERHKALAEAAGVPVKVCELPSLAQDVDLPEDLAYLIGQADNWLRGEPQPPDPEELAES